MILNYSLHKIYQKDNCPFSEAEYSNFKFGDVFYAEKFALTLFNGFIQQYSSLVLSQTEIVLLPSPYHSIPTASNFLCSYFKKHLNQFLYKNGKSACIETKIHRKQTYIEDYGNLDFENRMKLISNDTYYIDQEFINDKFCIFLDDIKITGSHERTVNKILDEYNVKGCFLFIYFAELANKEIHPNIENHYNYFSVKSVNDLVKIINRTTFRFNTRIIKYILGMDDENFEEIMNSISTTIKQELLSLAISNNYHQIEEYQHNIYKLNNKKIWLSTYKREKEGQSVLQNLPLV